MEYHETQDYKYEKSDELKAINIDAYDLDDIDPRLTEYCKMIQRDPNGHNLYEILAVTRFFRLLDKYYFSPEPVWRICNLLEKGLKFTTMEGQRNIVLSPCQVFQFANIYGFYYDWVNPDDPTDTDIRRLTRDAIIFIPRKFGKTTQTVAIAAYDFLFGDHNGQTYIASNTDKQALICFNEVRAVMEDVDTERMLRTTAHGVYWKKRAFRKGDPNARSSFIESLSGGIKGKDGLNASCYIYDEYGSAFYVKDHSDGANLLNVIESSMVQRREPLGVIITTAGKHKETPFRPMLDNAKKMLRGEIDNDRLFAHIFQPDAWEMDDAHICLESVWRKVHPHYGVTIQPTAYADDWQKAKDDAEKYAEFKTKMLNIFMSENATEWLSDEDIRKRTGTRRIDDLTMSEGWECYVAMDFSKGHDLNGQVYLCHRLAKDADGTMKHEFFADCDAWISEEEYTKATLNPLYREWVAQGWLHISDGGVIDENLILNRIIEVSKHANIIQFGYDKFDSARFVNAINAWLWGMGIDPKNMMKIISQSFASFNAPVQAMEYLLKVEPAVIEFSPNPLFAWCFGNCVLLEDSGGFENVKPVKRAHNLKIDIAICMLMCLILYYDDDNNKIIL